MNVIILHSFCRFGAGYHDHHTAIALSVVRGIRFVIYTHFELFGSKCFRKLSAGLILFERARPNLLTNYFGARIVQLQTLNPKLYT